MRFDKFSFGSIQIDGSTYEHDVVIDRGEILKRKKKPSKQFREQFGHTPLSVEDTVEMSAPRGRNRRARRASSDGRSQRGRPNGARLNCWSCRPPKPSRLSSQAPTTLTQCFT